MATMPDVGRISIGYIRRMAGGHRSVNQKIYTPWLERLMNKYSDETRNYFVAR
jgi:hypothetical protein